MERYNDSLVYQAPVAEPVNLETENVFAASSDYGFTIDDVIEEEI